MSVVKINSGVLLTFLSWVGLLLVPIYIFSMVVHPFFNGDWGHVQKVWSSWQALNVGIIAFISSLIAFNISRYNAEKQREREFVAARAFLPEALSELTEYFKSCAEMLCEAWALTKNTDSSSKVTLLTAVPVLRGTINEVFSECIRHGSPVIAEHLAEILMHLQVNNSRLKGLKISLSENSVRLSSMENIKSYMFYLAHIQALINKTFSFARGGKKFITPEVGLDDMTTAYLNLDIKMEIMDDLSRYTKDRLERKNA